MREEEECAERKLLEVKEAGRKDEREVAEEKIRNRR